MGLGPRSGRRFQAGGRRGRGAPRSGRSPAERPPSARPREGLSASAPEAPPHLSPESLGYFRRALSALKEAPASGEERGRDGRDPGWALARLESYDDGPERMNAQRGGRLPGTC